MACFFFFYLSVNWTIKVVVFLSAFPCLGDVWTDTFWFICSLPLHSVFPVSLSHSLCCCSLCSPHQPTPTQLSAPRRLTALSKNSSRCTRADLHSAVALRLALSHWNPTWQRLFSNPQDLLPRSIQMPSYLSDTFLHKLVSVTQGFHTHWSSFLVLHITPPCSLLAITFQSNF